MRFNRIADLSEIRRMPRVGKIHLGIKKTNPKGAEYPSETDYFVFESENPYREKIEKLYGPKPKALPIAFPVEDPERLFSQSLKYYGASKGLMCTGDGERALRIEGFEIGASSKEFQFPGGKRPEMIEIECPYRECADFLASRCKQMGNLFVTLPEVTLAGVWQVDTGSYHSIVDLNSSIAYVREVVGRVSMLFDPRNLSPFLTLRRVAKETHGSGKKVIHFPMIVELNADLRTVMDAARTLRPAPHVELPEPSRENYLIPRDVRESLPPEPEAEPAKPNDQGERPEPNTPPASAKGEVVDEPKKPKVVPPQTPAPKPAQRKLSLF